jgi:hypothetical protein
MMPAGTRRYPPVLAAALAVAASSLTACSSSGSPLAHAPALPSVPAGVSLPGAGSTTAPAAATGTVSRLTVRYANVYSNKGQAGPALDIYDTQLGTAAKPVVANLAYGSVSAYFHPRLQPNSPNITELYVLPAGADPVANKDDGKGIGGFQDDGSHPQVTVLLTGEKDTIEPGPLGGLSVSERVEKGTDNGGASPVAPPAAAGQGEFLVDQSDIDDVAASGTGNFLLLDSSCAPPLNGDPNEKDLPGIFAADDSPIKSTFAIFPAAPGSHQLALAHPASSANITCASLTPRLGATTFTLAAGQLVETYVYGTSATDLHLLFAPVAP